MEVTGGARQGAIQDVEFKKTIKLGYEAPCSIYPEIAKLLKIEGAVELNITLSDEGRPISIDVVQGPNELRSAAIEYAQNLQFDKPKQNPSTHSQATTIGIIFKLKCP